MKKKILIIAPEVYPQIKVGGLGKMVAGVAEGLGRLGSLEGLGIETKVIAPEKEIYSPLGKKETEVNYRSLGKKAVDWCWRNNWRPDWLWIHDWGGVWSAKEFLAGARRTASRRSPDTSHPLKVIWTVHSPVGNNYGYEYGYESPTGSDKPIDWGDSFFNFSGLVKEGVRISDLVTTVSGSFARRLERHPLFSEAGSVVGISNGVGSEEWEVKSDKLIGFNFRNSWKEFKERNKLVLQGRMGLPIRQAPIFAFVSRMVPQKGLDLLLKVLPKFVGGNDLQFVFVGSGRKKFLKEIQKLRNQFPEKIAARLETDFELPHQVFAGADFLVLPSVAEPFGIVVAEAKKYGVVPVVHLVDGLKDQVKDNLDGFGFNGYRSENLRAKLEEALKSWQSEWQKKFWLKTNEVENWQTVSREWKSLLYE